MKKLIVLSLLGLLGLACLVVEGYAEETQTPVYFKAGPLELYIPLKTAAATYMYDFNADKDGNLIGAETTIATVWNRVEGTVGGVTSLAGEGTPFIGGNILIGNIIEKWVAFPPDLKIGGFGGWDFRDEHPIYGFKASIKLW